MAWMIQHNRTGDDVKRSLKNIPCCIPTGTPTHIPHITRSNGGDIQHLKDFPWAHRTMPFEERLNEAISLGTKLEDERAAMGRTLSPETIHYRFPNFGIITLSAIRMLAQVVFTRRVAEQLVRLESWIDKDVRQANPAFSVALKKRLFKDPGFGTMSFSPDYIVHTAMHKETFFSICHDSWLDEGAIAFLQLTLARCYGQDDKTLFMPPLTPGLEWGYGRHLLATGAPTKMFAVVHMGDHWGVAYFDLQDCTIAFGDSQHRDTPLDQITNIVNWLSPSDRRTDWDKALLNIGHQSFPVQQQSDSFSCGILAIMSIERACNPYVDWSSHTSPAAQRIRFLQLLSGFTQIRNDASFAAYWSHHAWIPKQTQHEEFIDNIKHVSILQKKEKQMEDQQEELRILQGFSEKSKRDSKKRMEEKVRLFKERLTANGTLTDKLSDKPGESGEIRSADDDKSDDNNEKVERVGKSVASEPITSPRPRKKVKKEVNALPSLDRTSKQKSDYDQSIAGHRNST
ncbi:hypothetical protein EC991_010473, partial [Linnemannia zychae]